MQLPMKQPSTPVKMSRFPIIHNWVKSFTEQASPHLSILFLLGDFGQFLHYILFFSFQFIQVGSSTLKILIQFFHLILKQYMLSYLKIIYLADHTLYFNTFHYTVHFTTLNRSTNFWQKTKQNKNACHIRSSKVLHYYFT